MSYSGSQAYLDGGMEDDWLPQLLELSSSFVNGSCQSWSPLASPTGNSLNPCFVSLIFGIFSLLGGAFALFQLISLSLYGKNLGKFDLKHDNIVHYIRANSVLLQAILYLFVVSGYVTTSIPWTDLKVSGFGITAFVIFAILLPLHVIETKNTLVQSGSLLSFWLFNIILNLGVFVQQLFSTVKIFPIEYVDILLLFNSISIFGLEYLNWAPSKELTEYYESRDIQVDDRDIISKASFSYINPLLVQGMSSKSIRDEDIPELVDLDKTADAAKRMEVHWNNQKKKKKPSLGLTLLLTIAFTAITSILLEFLNNVLSFLQPQLLRLLITFFNSDADTPLIVGFAIAGGMFLTSLIGTFLFNKFFILNFEAAMRSKAGLMSLVYLKALRLSPEARAEKSTGQIVNLMSVDVNRVQDVTSFIQQLISAPIRLVLCLISLHSLIGNALWGGVLVLVVMIPINTLLVKSIRELHKKQMVYKDKRTKLVNEILTSIKSIKLYSWENSMMERLRHVRNDEELKNLQKIGCFQAGGSFSWNAVPFLVSCMSFWLFAKFSKTPLTPDLIFPALTLFDLLGEPIFALPAIITGLIEMNIALGRLSSFLLADEVDDSYVRKHPKVHHKGDVAIDINNATFLWSKLKTGGSDVDEESEISSPKVALKNVKFQLRKGELSCVVGRVGSGKSTFMQSILGELQCYPSDESKPIKFDVYGEIAYCAQVPWVMNASVKQNILFGKRYDEEFYQQTIKACQLLDDLEILPDGDETIVGEKGISLSGGQKARVSLARAVYKRADVYLLDDILSAVDAHVGKHITDEVLGSNGLLASKTIVLATNSVPILAHSKNILLLEHGEIKETGSFKQVLTAKSDLYQLINEYGHNQESSEQPIEEILNISSDDLTTDEEEKELQDLREYTGGVELDIAINNLEPLERVVSHVTLRRPSDATFKVVRLDFDKGSNDKRTAQEAERIERGKVKSSVYLAYARSSSYFGIALFLFFVFAGQALTVSSSFWLKKWSEANDKAGGNDNVGKFIGVYVLLGFSGVLCVLLNTCVLWIFCAIRSSMQLHDGMAQSIIRAPMSFFETTPIGRIINRFSNDINKIDDWLPRTFSMFLRNLVSALFTIFVISVSLPSILLVIGLLSILYIYFQRYFMATSRQLKRYQSTSVSPIYAHLQETLNGRETIKAYGEEERFKFLNAAHIDYNMKMFYIIRAVNRWITTRLQVIGALIIFSASSLAILTRLSEHPVTSGMVGLAMSYALQITSSLNMIVRMTVEVETSVVSVERVLEYSKLTPELPLVIANHRPPAYWPSKGAVKFDHYSTKYRANLDPVLNDVCLDIKPEEKIGIVGRTGAGKSTLALSIYRLIEPTEGHIDIDEINTSEIGLHDLRHKLSIIPQDSQILEGTVRQNLDPLDEYSDEQLWSVIKLAHLKDVVTQMSTDEELMGLEAKLSEGGSNLSVGQRQLFCLARALLNTSKILILDEATAAVDVQTDKILQETIRSEFANKTILTIAHRLDTVMDSDRIVVLDKGSVKEFDTPQNLLKDTNSIFYSLCQQGGYLNDSN